MACSRSGVSKVAWPMRLGLIMALSPLRPRIHLHHFFQCTEWVMNAIGDEFKGHSPGSGRKRGNTIAQFAALDPSCTRPTSTYTLDKIEIFGESLCEQHRTQESKRTWPATSSRPTKPPMALAPAWGSTPKGS